MPQIQTLELTDNHAKIVIEPLERGYGITTPVLFELDEGWTIQGVEVGEHK